MDINTPTPPPEGCISCEVRGHVLLIGINRPAKRNGRSEERRVGKECRSRWSPYH